MDILVETLSGIQSTNVGLFFFQRGQVRHQQWAGWHKDTLKVASLLLQNPCLVESELLKLEFGQ